MRNSTGRCLHATASRGRRVELSRASYKESRNNNTVEVSQATARLCASIERSIVTVLRRKDTKGEKTLSWRVSCSDEDRAEVRARIRLPEDALTPVSEAYRWNSESRLNRTLGLLEERTTYDTEYVRNRTAFLGAVTVDVNLNVTESVTAMAQRLSENVGSMDVAAGANIVAMALGAANRLEEVREMSLEVMSAYVGTVVDYVGEVTDRMAKIGAWFEAFNGLGAVLDTINIGMTPSVTPPLPPALQIGEIPGVPPDVSRMIRDLGESASAMSAEISRIADDVRVDLAADASVIPRAVSEIMKGVPTVFDDYDPPPRGNNANFTEVVRDDAMADGDAFENKTAELVTSFENERIRVVEEKAAEALSRVNASDPVTVAATKVLPTSELNLALQRTLLPRSTGSEYPLRLCRFLNCVGCLRCGHRRPGSGRHGVQIRQEFSTHRKTSLTSWGCFAARGSHPW